VAQLWSLGNSGYHMKVRIYSWILATSYMLLGIVLYLVIPKFIAIFSGFDLESPFLTRSIFAIGPFGCLFFSAIIGIIVILKDFKFPSPYLNHFFALFLVLWVGCTLISIIRPIYEASGPIAVSPNKSPEPTAVTSCVPLSRASFLGRRWFSFGC
jgi:hypothetical protein